MKINAEKFYSSIYKIIGDSTPLKIDCGKICNGACCEVTDEITGMYLFPFEEVKYINMPSWGKIYDTDFCYKKGKEVLLFTCTGKCEREKRPLSCRIFPLAPYVSKDNEFNIIIDPRAKGLCPLASVMDIKDLDKLFVKRVSKALSLCMKVRECREFMYAQSRLFDEF